MKTKMYCVFSKPSLTLMKGIRGKLATQAGHAYLHAYWDALERFPEDAKKYQQSKHPYKITCVVDTDLELEKLASLSQYVGFTKVVDAGFTVFNQPTLTCVGIGPINDDNPYSGLLMNLKLLT